LIASSLLIVYLSHCSEGFIEVFTKTLNAIFWQREARLVISTKAGSTLHRSLKIMATKTNGNNPVEHHPKKPQLA
jgi:hypothetical protein